MKKCTVKILMINGEEFYFETNDINIMFMCI